MGMNERIYYSSEAAQQAMRERAIIAFITAILGLSLGVMIALILAPQSGEKTRRAIGEQVENLVHSGSDTVNKVASTVREQVEQVGERLSNSR